MDKEVVNIVDRRTGAAYDLPFFKGAVRAMDLRQIKPDPKTSA
jgi:hypothetical protein